MKEREKNQARTHDKSAALYSFGYRIRPTNEAIAIGENDEGFYGRSFRYRNEYVAFAFPKYEKTNATTETMSYPAI